MGMNDTNRWTDSDLLKRIREFTDSAIKAESTNRTEAVADLKFLAGEQWDEATKRARQLEGRPCLTFNRLPTYLHQVTNDQRQNKVGIKVHPVGHGADEKGAEIYQGMIKQIENSSNADTAYDTAVNSAAGIGFGFWRLITEYESPTSFNQVIKYQRIRDALKVYFDPASVEGDGSDAKQCVIVSDMAARRVRPHLPGQAGRLPHRPDRDRQPDPARLDDRQHGARGRVLLLRLQGRDAVPAGRRHDHDHRSRRPASP
jgi:hypothetical protein